MAYGLSLNHPRGISRMKVVPSYDYKPEKKQPSRRDVRRANAKRKKMNESKNRH